VGVGGDGVLVGVEVEVEVGIIVVDASGLPQAERKRNINEMYFHIFLFLPWD
jgi:hypothetical protein